MTINSSKVRGCYAYVLKNKNITLHHTLLTPGTVNLLGWIVSIWFGVLRTFVNKETVKKYKEINYFL